MRDTTKTDTDQVKVLYIAGWGRSGSTLLGDILGEIDGHFAVGELRYIWQRNLLEHRLCACGVPLPQCPVWSQILRQAFGDLNRSEIENLARLARRARTRHVPRMLVPRLGKGLADGLKEYRQVLASLYRAIARVTGASVIVDTSKFPSYAWLLSTIDTIDLYVVHLVRDPRAVAFSWLRKKLQRDAPGETYISRHSPVESTLLWDTWNLSTEQLFAKYPGRYLLLRYEDFVRSPRSSVQHILDMVGADPSVALPFTSPTRVRLGIHHTTSGNPNRFTTGEIDIREDNQWLQAMKPLHAIVTTLLAWPWLPRYGYPRHLRLRGLKHARTS